MLENNFTELDNDFITIWSKYILSSDYMLIKNDLEKLAELGQVNAVQSYYLFLQKGDKSNEIIDKIVDEYQGSNFNHLLAKAHKEAFIENFEDLYNEYASAYNQYENSKQALSDMAWNGYCNFEGRCYELDKDTDNLKSINALAASRANNVWKLITNSKSFIMREQAKNSAFEQYKISLNPLCLQRYFDLIMGNFYMNKNEERLFKHNNKNLRSTLKNLFKKNPTSPEIAYALGKNLSFGNDKKKLQSKEILSTLANRPYSKTLQEYQLKEKTTKETEKTKAE